MHLTITRTGEIKYMSRCNYYANYFQSLLI